MTYLSRLLSGVTADRLNPIFSQRSILIPRMYLYCDFRDTRDSQEPVLLDCLVDPTMGTVVPQRLPPLPRTREHQTLQTPIFFTQSDGSVGIALSDVLSPDGSLSLGSNQYNGSDSDNTILILNVGRSCFLGGLPLTPMRSGRAILTTPVSRCFGTQGADTIRSDDYPSKLPPSLRRF